MGVVLTVYITIELHNYLGNDGRLCEYRHTFIELHDNYIIIDSHVISTDVNNGATETYPVLFALCSHGNNESPSSAPNNARIALEISQLLK